MKSGEYTTTVTITLDDEREFDISFTSHWTNDGIGAYECQGYRGFDKGVDYFEQIDDWTAETEVTDLENKEIQEYIDDNERNILNEMAEEYDPYYNCPY